MKINSSRTGCYYFAYKFLVKERRRVTQVLSEAEVKAIREEPRFHGIKPIEDREKTLLFPGIYGRDAVYAEKVLRSGTDCGNIHALEREMAGFIGRKYAVALGSGTEAVHAALRLAAERICGSRGEDSKESDGGNRAMTCRGEKDSAETGGLLKGQRVFCSDLTSPVMADAVLCEGGEPVFIDVSAEDWGMDPDVLELAFERYPDVKIVMMAHVYGFPGQIERVKEICEMHDALLIEDACESLGAAIGGRRTGSFGDYGVLSFHDRDLMPEIEGGMLLVDDFSEAEKVRGWLSGDFCAWRGVPGYNRQMEDVTAGMIRTRMHRLDGFIVKKRAIYDRYRKSFSEDLMQMNPVGEGTEPDYGTPCMTVESSIGFIEKRTEQEYEYVSQHGTAAPMEILDALTAFGAEGRPVWKPMHMQPLFRDCDQMTLDGSRKDYESSGHSDLFVRSNESADIFRKGICLPADVRMTEEEQDRVIDIIFSCYNRRELDREIWRAI